MGFWGGPVGTVLECINKKAKQVTGLFFSCIGTSRDGRKALNLSGLGGYIGYEGPVSGLKDFHSGFFGANTRAHKKAGRGEQLERWDTYEIG